VDEVFAMATAPAKEVKATACRAWKVRVVNALGAGVEDAAVSAAAVVEGVFEAAVESPLPVSLRRPSTDHAVVKRVKKNPPTTTPNIFSTSVAEPKLGAKGSAIKLGTKNTGSHLASSAAPGLNSPCTASPKLLLDDGDPSVLLKTPSKRRAPKRAPHPARDGGNGMAYLAKSVLKAMSRAMRRPVERTVTGVEGDDAAVEDEVAVAAACRGDARPVADEVRAERKRRSDTDADDDNDGDDMPSF